MLVIQQFLIEIYRHHPTENSPLTTYDLHDILKTIIKRKRYSESYLSRLLKMLRNSGEIARLRTTCFPYSPNSLDSDFYFDRFCYYITEKGKKRAKYLYDKYK